MASAFRTLDVTHFVSLYVYAFFVDKLTKNMESQYMDFGSLAHLKGRHCWISHPKRSSANKLWIQIFMGNESSPSNHTNNDMIPEDKCLHKYNILIGSMYGCAWFLMVNVGKYTIHGSYGPFLHWSHRLRTCCLFVLLRHLAEKGMITPKRAKEAKPGSSRNDSHIIYPQLYYSKCVYWREPRNHPSLQGLFDLQKKWSLSSQQKRGQCSQEFFINQKLLSFNPK